MTGYCKGCKDYFAFEKSIGMHCCPYLSFNHDGKCPCRICIIKIMCNDACDAFEDFITGYIDFDRVFKSKRGND